MPDADILHLEPHGVDTYVGSGPQYPWGGLYGGQIIAQALRAATLSLGDDAKVPHSLRAYFIRPGDHDEPVRYEVDRLRNGRSFSTRRVVARQAIGAILNLEASFTAPTSGASLARRPMPDVAGPDAGRDDAWTELFERRVLPMELGTGQVHEWLRFRDDTHADGATAFAFLSDDVPTDAVRCFLTQPGDDLELFDQSHFMVSLDHTVWFHEPVEAHEWHLHAFSCDRVVGDRALTNGLVYAADGRHVATIAQEVLVRRRRRDA
jgi:acyl-CoA thioesterase-2